MAIFHTGKRVEFYILPVGSAGAAVYDDSASPANGLPAGEIDSITIDTTGGAATTDVTVTNNTTGELMASTTNLAAKTNRKVRGQAVLPDGTSISGASDSLVTHANDLVQVVVAQANAVALKITITYKP